MRTPPRSEPALDNRPGAAHAPFPSSAQRRVSRWPLLLFVIVMAVLLALAARWWLAREAGLPLQHAQPDPKSQSTQLKPPMRPLYPAPNPQAAQESRQANKCVLGGKVSYSDGPCPQGATTITVWLEEASTPIPLPRAIAVAAPPAPAFVPRNTPAPAATPFQPSVQSPQAQCRAIEDYINWLDSLGRQPNSSYTMDWIRSERKEARDQQFRLRC